MEEESLVVLSEIVLNMRFVNSINKMIKFIPARGAQMGFLGVFPNEEMRSTFMTDIFVFLTGLYRLDLTAMTN